MAVKVAGICLVVAVVGLEEGQVLYMRVMLGLEVRMVELEDQGEKQMEVLLMAALEWGLQEF